MSEYRHIASLRGPGAEVTPGQVPENPAVIDEDTDWQNIEAGFYRLNSSSVAPHIGLPFTANGSVEILRTGLDGKLARFFSSGWGSSSIEYWVLGQTVAGTWDEHWEKMPRGLGIENLVHDSHDWVENDTVTLVLNNKHVAFDFGAAEEFETFSPYFQNSEHEDRLNFASNSSHFASRRGHVNLVPSTRMICHWDFHGDFSDGEVLILCSAEQPGDNNTVGGAVLRGSQGFRQGYLAGITGPSGENSIVIRRLNDPDSGPNTTLLGSAPFDISLPGSYFIRLRAEGDAIKAKAWSETAPEPEGWMVEAADATYAEGRAGFGKSSGPNARWGYISVNRDGGKA